MEGGPNQLIELYNSIITPELNFNNINLRLRLWRIGGRKRKYGLSAFVHRTIRCVIDCEMISFISQWTAVFGWLVYFSISLCILCGPSSTRICLQTCKTAAKRCVPWTPPDFRLGVPVHDRCLAEKSHSVVAK